MGMSWFQSWLKSARYRSCIWKVQHLLSPLSESFMMFLHQANYIGSWPVHLNRRRADYSKVVSTWGNNGLNALEVSGGSFPTGGGGFDIAGFNRKIPFYVRRQRLKIHVILLANSNSSADSENDSCHGVILTPWQEKNKKFEMPLRDSRFTPTGSAIARI